MLSSLPRHSHQNNPLAANAAAKNTQWTFTATTHARTRARLDGVCPWPSLPDNLGCSQVQPRRTARLVRGSARASLPLGWTQGQHTAWSHGKGRLTARRRGDSELPARLSGQPELGPRPQHHP